MANREGHLEALYARHVPTVTRIAYLLTGDAQRAQDIAHDAFIKASSKVLRLRRPDAFGAYLTRTAVNLCKRYGERRAIERRHLEREAALARDTTTEVDVESRDEVLRLLDALPPRQRAALVLKFYADLPESEIAEVLGCAPGTVKSLVSRGIAAVREQLGGSL